MTNDLDGVVFGFIYPNHVVFLIDKASALAGLILSV